MQVLPPIATSTLLRVFHKSLDVAGETRSDARVASEGPRAPVKKTPLLYVGRGPVPRHAAIAEDRPPRYGKKTVPFTVGRGPSQVSTRAGERVSLAIVRVIQRSRGTGPRATRKKTPLLHVGRGPVPRHRSRARSCSSGSPDPDPFVIRRSQTTEVETHDDGTRGGQAPALRGKNGTSS